MPSVEAPPKKKQRASGKHQPGSARKSGRNKQGRDRKGETKEHIKKNIAKARQAADLTIEKLKSKVKDLTEQNKQLADDLKWERNRRLSEEADKAHWRDRCLVASGARRKPGWSDIFA